MEDALTQLLLSDPRLTAYVGDRIDWGLSPQGISMPRIAMHDISLVAAYTYEGEDDLKATRVQFDIVAETNRQARKISEVLGEVLGGRTATIGEVALSGIFRDGSRSMSEGTDAERITVRRDDYILNWKRVRA